MTAERTTAPTASPPPPVFAVATQDALPLGPQWEEGADFLARISAAKQFTGAGLAADWHRAQCIAACVVAGLSVREIAAGHGCSVNVVTRVLGVVAERAPEVVTAMRKRLSGQMTMLASMLSASMVEDIVSGKLKPEHKPVALGIVATQSALLAGDPTSRIERTSAPDAAGLRERLGQILDVEEVPSDSVSGAERAELPNQGPVSSVTTVLDTVPTTSAEPIPAVQGPATADQAERPAGPLEGRREAAGAADGEGGGVVFARGGLTSLTGRPPQNFGEGASA